MLNDSVNERKKQRPKLALVLGSGSVRCLAGIGLWEVFHRENIPIDMVIGCSGSSMVAAAIAYGIDPGQCKEGALRLWDKKIFKIDYRNLPKILLPRLLGFNFSFGLYKDTDIMKNLEVFFGDLSIEGANIPLYIMATDLNTGKSVVLSKGKVTDAIRASMSLPIILSPKKINGILLTDGGAADPLPIDVAIKEGADVIVALVLESPYQEDVNSLGSLVQQLTSISINNLLKRALAFHNLAHHHEIVLVLPKFEERIGGFDFDKIPEIIEVGKRAAKEELPYIKSLISGD